MNILIHVHITSPQNEDHHPRALVELYVKGDHFWNGNVPRKGDEISMMYMKDRNGRHQPWIVEHVVWHYDNGPGATLEMRDLESCGDFQLDLAQLHDMGFTHIDGRPLIDSK